MLASISSSITTGIAHHGVYAVFALMLIDAVFPALSELVMLYAGALAAGAVGGAHPLLFGSSLSFGATAFIALALAGTLGYLTGGLIGWLIGIYGGRPLILHHGGWLHLNEGRVSLAERWFDRHGSAFVLLGRITPLLRSFVSIPAGIFRIPLGRYSLLTLLGSAIWAFAFAGAGYGLGSGYQRVHNDFRYAEYAVLAAASLATALLVRRHLLPAVRRANSRNGEPPMQTPLQLPLRSSGRSDPAASARAPLAPKEGREENGQHRPEHDHDHLPDSHDQV